MKPMKLCTSEKNHFWKSFLKLENKPESSKILISTGSTNQLIELQ